MYNFYKIIEKSHFKTKIGYILYMKILFVLFFLLSPCLLFGQVKGGDTFNKSYYDEPCNLQRSAIEIINHLNSDIKKHSNFPRPIEDTRLDENYFPHTGKLEMPDNSSFGSGTFLGIRQNGVISRNKVITSAHNFFTEDGELLYPLESYKFKIGNDTEDPDAVFNITKIECIGTGYNKARAYEDMCIITTDKELPGHIEPAKPWNEKFKSLEQAIDSASEFYTAGYHGYWKKYENRRMHNFCTKMNLYNQKNKFISSDCNTSPGLSGGGAYASIRNKDGTYEDYYIGSNKGFIMGTSTTTISPYFGPSSTNFNTIVVTKDNQYKFMNTIVSN